MRFWDSSAVLPLLVDEPGAAAMVALQVEDPAAAVWWLTPMECRSVLGRLERERRAWPLCCIKMLVMIHFDV